MVWIYFNYSVMPLLLNNDLGHMIWYGHHGWLVDMGTTAGSLEGQSGCPIFNHIFEQMGDNAANINFPSLAAIVELYLWSQTLSFFLKLN